jgi:Protein of unknown function (DUF3306)
MKEERDRPAGASPSDEGAGDRNFLARWSRRKAEARATPAAPAESAKSAPAPEEAVDPATLPSIDSLTAESDYTVFLRKGVPESLRTAALRKLWRTERSVLEYVPLVEYNWDFNAPGYGALRATDDVTRLLRGVLGTAQQIAEHLEESHGGGAEGSAEAPEPAARREPAPTSELPPPVDAAGPAAPDSLPDSGAVPRPRRRHGSALPT